MQICTVFHLRCQCTLNFQIWELYSYLLYNSDVVFSLFHWLDHSHSHPCWGVEVTSFLCLIVPQRSYGWNIR